MLPRLQAQERLGAIDVAILAAGGFEQRDARRMMTDLRSRASGEDRPRARKASAAQLGAIGIAFVEMPPKRALNDG